MASVLVRLVVRIPRPKCEAAAFVSALRGISEMSPSVSVKLPHVVADLTLHMRQRSDMRINDFDAGHGNRLEHKVDFSTAEVRSYRGLAWSLFRPQG